MTNQEAIKTLRELRRETNDSWYEEVYDKAISALEKLYNVSSAQPDVPDTNVGDMVSRRAAIDALMAEPLKWDDSSVWESARCHQWMMDMDVIKALPSAEPDNHEVACLLAELFGDTCACNFNGIDEWLPDKCEFLDACPDPGGVTCWEQFLKHRAERRADE